MRRFFIGLTLFCLALPLAWKELAAVFLMGAARVTLGARLVYRDLHFKNGKFFFDDLVVFNRSGSYFFRAQSVEIDRSLHMEIGGVHLTLSREIFSEPVSSSLNWSCHLEGGKLDWIDGTAPSFEFEFQKKPDGRSELFLERGATRVSIELENGTVFSASWNEVLLEWLGETEGVISGHCKGQLGPFELESLYLKAKGLKGEAFSVPLGGNIEFDWEGRFAASSFDWKELLSSTESTHLTIEQGIIGSISELECAASYKRGLGGKWEGTGKARSGEELFPCSFDATMALSLEREAWGKVDLQLGDGTVHYESEEGRISWEKFGPKEIGVVHNFAKPLVALANHWNWVSGSADGTAKWDLATNEMDLESLSLKDVAIQSIDRSLSFGWERGEYLGNGELSSGWFETGQFKGSDWSIDWDQEEGVARVSGLIGKEKANFKIQNVGFGGGNFGFDLFEVNGPLFSVGSIRNASFQLYGNSEEWTVIELEGTAEFAIGDSVLEIPFESPSIRIEDRVASFDLRAKRRQWDFVRLVGEKVGETIYFDSDRSHILGEKVDCNTWQWDEAGLVEAHLKSTISIPLLSALLEKSAPLPEAGRADISIAYERGEPLYFSCEGIETMEKGDPFPFQFALDRDRIGLHFGSLCAEAEVRFDEQRIELSGGKGAIAGIEFDFLGSLNWGCDGHFAIPHFHTSLKQIDPLLATMNIPALSWNGSLEGKGNVVFNLQAFEADLEFIPKEIELRGFQFENAGAVQLFLSSSQGAVLKGLDFTLKKESVMLQGKVGLCQIDTNRRHWVMQKTYLHLPADLLAQFSLPAAKFFDPGHEVDLVAEIDSAFDFSSFTCDVKEGFLPVGGETRHLKDLHLVYDTDRCVASSLLFHQNKIAKIGLEMEIDPELEGRLSLQDGEEPPLVIDWAYGKEGLSIHSMEGFFAGIDASFHALNFGVSSELIGTARIHFQQVAEWIPLAVAEVFHELEMGKGYELMGHLTIDRTHWNDIQFKGILSGKQIDLFNYQLRTLMAQAELSLHRVHLYDLKISDSAGVLKIDDLLIAGEGDAPWTIAIPKLVIEDLRPSLLHSPGEEPGPLSPLVIRKLTLNDFKGLVADGKTYTAKGDLSFINSFRRGEEILDIPPNLFGRIIGLDVDLLIPVVGDLTFHVKDGYFQLDELSGAFSAAKRSEFFLVKSDTSPRMDLKGNLQILIEMKQFILFKFTDAFMISVEGKLNNPDFRLQKKRRFLSLGL